MTTPQAGARAKSAPSLQTRWPLNWSPEHGPGRVGFLFSPADVDRDMYVIYRMMMVGTSNIN